MSSQDMVHLVGFPLNGALKPGLFSYLDGGAGSAMLQVAMAGMLAAAFVYRSALTGIRNAFKRIRRPE